MDVSFSRWRRRKAKENNVPTLAVQTECMMQMLNEQVSPFLVFLAEKKNSTSLGKWDVQNVREGRVRDYECSESL